MAWYSDVYVLDILVFSIVFLSSLCGCVRGLTKETVSILSWSMATWLSFYYAEPLANLFVNHIHTPLIRLSLAAAVLIICVFLLGMFLKRFLSWGIEKVGLKMVDHALGLGFGVVRGGLLSLLLVVVCVQLVTPKAPWIESSVSGKPLWAFWEERRSSLPSGFSWSVLKLSDRITPKVEENIKKAAYDV